MTDGDHDRMQRQIESLDNRLHDLETEGTRPTQIHLTNITERLGEMRAEVRDFKDEVRRRFDELVEERQKKAAAEATDKRADRRVLLSAAGTFIVGFALFAITTIVNWVAR